MRIAFFMIGKTKASYLVEGNRIFENRIKRYVTFESVLLPTVKNAAKLPPPSLKLKEAQVVLSKLEPSDFLVLLDERGKSLTSIAFANWLENRSLQGNRRLVFLVGGAYGFDELLYQRADYKLSLSSMTFSHQMIRLFFLEQLYRAFTILNGEPYHNE